MPEMGFEVEPISPVSRDDTVTNRKPNATIITAPARFMCSVRAAMMAIKSAITPPTTKLVGRSWSVRGRAWPSPALAAARVACKSLRPPFSPRQIIGNDSIRLISPPVATAPAPI